MQRALFFTFLVSCSSPNPPGFGSDAATDTVSVETDVIEQNDAHQDDELGEICEEISVYDVDEDGDGFAPIGSDERTLCLTKSERKNYVTLARDCNDNDPLQYPRSPGICGDNVVDDCDGPGPVMMDGALCDSGDQACPDTATGSLDDPNWNCEGVAPRNVYAFAKLPPGNRDYEDGGCFIFFEGYPDGFYVKHTLRGRNQDPLCNTAEGCICPTADGVPSYDRRLYAFTKNGDADTCENIRLQDHGCDEDLVQPVSNDCRKYLYQLHPFESNEAVEPIERPYSFFANSYDEIIRRLATFETVEVACVENSNIGLDWATLASSPVELSPTFVKAPVLKP